MLDDWIDGTGYTPDQVLASLRNGMSGMGGASASPSSGMIGMDMPTASPAAEMSGTGMVTAAPGGHRGTGGRYAALCCAGDGDQR